MKGTGIEALLFFLLCADNAHSLEEGGTDYGIRLEEMEAREILELIGMARKRLSELGVAEPPQVFPERLRISRELRIFLPDRGNRELRLQPLVKTLFVFFLKHPEGVVFKNLVDYREELFKLYSRVCQSDDLDAMSAVVDRLIDPYTNSVNTMRTRLSKALSEYFPDERLLALYRIKGTAGSEKTIALDRNFVIWEQ